MPRTHHDPPGPGAGRVVESYDAGSGGDDVERHRGRDLVVQPYRHRMRAEALDRVPEGDRAAVEVLTGDLGERDGDLRGGDGAEQATGRAGLDLHVHRAGLELALEVVGVLLVTDRSGGPGLLDRLDGLLTTTGPPDGDAAGQEVVAAVAVLDLHH